MKSMFEYVRHPRGHYPRGMVVTASGEAATFSGECDFPGICRVVDDGAGRKNGQWTPHYYAVFHRADSVFLSWIQDWDNGAFWPQSSWEDGLKWVAEQAPAISPKGFEDMIRRDWPSVAARWDKARADADEFGDDGLTEAQANEETKRLLAEHQAKVDAANRRSELAEKALELAGSLRWYLERAERAEAEAEKLEAKIRDLGGITEDEAKARAEAAEAHAAELRRVANALEDEAREAARVKAAEAKTHELQNGTWDALDALSL